MLFLDCRCNSYTLLMKLSLFLDFAKDTLLTWLMCYATKKTSYNKKQYAYMATILNSIHLTGLIKSIWFYESFFSNGMKVISTPQYTLIYNMEVVLATIRASIVNFIKCPFTRPVNKNINFSRWHLKSDTINLLMP